MARKEYILKMYQRYKNADKKQRSKLLDEMELTSELHRKHIIRALSKLKTRGRPRKNKPGRPKKYSSPVLLKVLKKIWLNSNQPCSSRLKAMIPDWIDGYMKSFGELDNQVKKDILTISASSINRLLKPVRIKHNKGRSTTKPGSLLKKHIPIKTLQWDESKPGFLEADTVAHCGTSISGQFVYTLDCVDIATGWTEQRAVWSKQSNEVVKQLKSIEKVLPFKILGFDSDNGSEFINHEVMKFCFDRHKKIEFTRARPYKKNDNAHVEQKNWTHVRQWVGYQRLEHREQVQLLNDVYESEWRILQNFYLPSVKLLDKQRIGSKTIKKHSKPKTPYRRIIESDEISDYHKNRLREVYMNTNPFELRDKIKEKLRKVFKYTVNKIEVLE